MNNLNALLLSKLKVAHQREAVLAGEHEVDVTVRIKGMVNVGEPYLTTPTSQLSPLTVIAIALSKVDANTRNRILTHIEAAAEEAYGDDAGGSMRDTVSKSIVDMIERVRVRFAQRLPKVMYNGKVTLHVDVKQLR